MQTKALQLSLILIDMNHFLNKTREPKSDITLEEIEETSALARSIMTDKRMVSLLDTFHGSKTIGLSSQFIFKEAYSDYSSQAWRPHKIIFIRKIKMLPT